MTGLRCHLLIRPPASGKTTLAWALAPLLSARGEPPAVVLSTDAIRAEVFGDATVQGPWSAIEQLLHQRIREAVAAGRPVIVDATHARRPWRLALTQALVLPAPVEWVGWWLFTPLATCLAWNQRRQRLVPEPVIKELAAALADPHVGPAGPRASPPWWRWCPATMKPSSRCWPKSWPSSTSASAPPPIGSARCSAMASPACWIWSASSTGSASLRASSSRLSHSPWPGPRPGAHP